MKALKKFFKIVGIIILSVILLASAADAAWVFLPRVISAKKISETKSVAKSIKDLKLPDSTKVIALGEAAHGNKEFQELKLDVLKHLVSTSDVRSFSLEADWGEGMAVNAYIHGKEGSAFDIVKSMSFSIYRTKEMIDLIEWMKVYNESAPDGEKLNFYGFDMQNPDKSLKFIVEYCKKQKILSDIDLEKSLFPMTPDNIKNISDILDGIAAKMTEEYTDEEDYIETAPYLQVVNAFRQSVEYYKLMLSDPVKSIQARDGYMAENVQWIQEYEEKLGHSKIFISGHNGHISFSSPSYITMGHNLKEHYNDSYFAIGTDFYYTDVNVPDFENDRARTVAHFCSADTLAYQAKYYNNRYLLQFSDVKAQGGNLDKIINSPLNMGSLGEEYYFFMKFLPLTYIIKQTPSELYNAMIFVYKASPIEIFE